jgi:hypothetical protein
MSPRRKRLAACLAVLALGGAGLTLGTPALAAGGFTLESSFGKAGVGLGQFSEPHGVAVETGTGDVFVVDTNNERVEKFEPEAGGKYKAVGVIEEGLRVRSLLGDRGRQLLRYA